MLSASISMTRVQRYVIFLLLYLSWFTIDMTHANSASLISQSAKFSRIHVLFKEDAELPIAVQSFYSSHNIFVDGFNSVENLPTDAHVIIYGCEEPSFLIGPKYESNRFLFICDQPKSYLLNKYPVLSTHASPVDQLNLALKFLPSDKRVATIYSNRSRYLYHYLIEAVQHRKDLTIDGYFHLGQFSIDSSVDKLLTDNDFLLALPDPDVFNRYTMKAILLKLFRLSRPVFGANEEMVKGGSLATLHLSGLALAKSAVELIRNAKKTLSAGIYFSDKYRVEVNHTVAESLSIAIPSDKEMLDYLRVQAKPVEETE